MEKERVGVRKRQIEKRKAREVVGDRSEKWYFRMRKGRFPKRKIKRKERRKEVETQKQNKWHLFRLKSSSVSKQVEHAQNIFFRHVSQ